MIYLSIIGNHDKVNSDQSYGAALTIFLQYKAKIRNVLAVPTAGIKTSTGVNVPRILPKVERA